MPQSSVNRVNVLDHASVDEMDSIPVRKLKKPDVVIQEIKRPRVEGWQLCPGNTLVATPANNMNLQSLFLAHGQTLRVRRRIEAVARDNRGLRFPYERHLAGRERHGEKPIRSIQHLQRRFGTLVQGRGRLEVELSP